MDDVYNCSDFTTQAEALAVFGYWWDLGFGTYMAWM